MSRRPASIAGLANTSTTGALTGANSYATAVVTWYDAHGNVVGTTDAQGQTASSAFDARDRRVGDTDRLAGVTSWRFDENSNLRHLTDAENQSPYRPTAWTYDARNLKLTEALPGRPGFWTSDDLEAARRQSNAFHCPDGYRRSGCGKRARRSASRIATASA